MDEGSKEGGILERERTVCASLACAGGNFDLAMRMAYVTTAVQCSQAGSLTRQSGRAGR